MEGGAGVCVCVNFRLSFAWNVAGSAVVLSLFIKLFDHACPVSSARAWDGGLQKCGT